MARLKAPNLVDTIKEIALNANQSSKPCNWVYGTVVSVEPLQIRIQSTIILTESFLVLSNLVKDHFVDVTVSMQTENDAFMIPDHTHNCPVGGTTDVGTLDTTHKHEIKHKIKMLQHYGLKTGEKVILLQMAGGKQYFVLDRVTEHICEGEWL